MKKSILTDVIATILVMLFLYASFSKIFSYAAFKRAMHDQPFPSWFSDLLILFIPIIEIIIAVLLMFEDSRKQGFYASTAIMGVFTLYIAGILLHFFAWEPCNCGGLINSLTWQQHLIFNLFFLIISIIGVVLNQTGLLKTGRPI